MNWRPILAILSVAVPVTVAVQFGLEWQFVGLAGLAGYVTVRWTVTTWDRTRIAASQYGRKDTCPNCKLFVRRQPGDWILTCHRCGWRAGWPVVRWVTRSVPSRQFRRTITYQEVAFGLIVVFVFVPIAGAFATSTLPITLEAFEPTDASDIENQQVEELILENVNERRAERGLPQLGHNEQVSQQARAHAEDMAAHDYLNHTAHNGQTAQQRYGFCASGENIAYTWFDKRVKTDDGTKRYTTEEELAKGLVTQWENSPPHRELLYGNQWSTAGVGIAITDDEKVYAVLGFCRPR